MKNLSFKFKKTPYKALCYALLMNMLLFNFNVSAGESKTPSSDATALQSVHLNKSTIDDLVTLKGIGHKKAQAILAYRQQMGGFKSINELTNVKGIGEKVLIENKARLKM